LPVLYKWTETRSFPSLGKNSLTMLLIGGFSTFSISSLQAQTPNSPPVITMDEALNRAVTNYPALKVSRLNIEQQKVLKKSAWDLGNTQIFTGGEEIGNNEDGVYTTVGIQQQNIDIFGIAPKLKAQEQRVLLSEAALNLDEAELRQQVKKAYARAYITRKNLELYHHLDSVYADFKRAAQIRYEVEETSKLAYLAALNQVKQITLQKTQLEYDYSNALDQLNLWLVSDTLFTVSNLDKDTKWTDPLILNDSLIVHPLLELASQEVNVAEADRKTAVAGLLPKLNAQYGIQEIGGQTGFYQYQLGLTIPLFFMPEQGKLQFAKIQQKIAEQNYRQTQFEIHATYQSHLREYKKWLESWEFYANEYLPLAREQRKGTILAYKEGAIDYLAFIQNLKETIQIEVQAQEAFDRYINAKFQLEYYLNSSKIGRASCRERV